MTDVARFGERIKLARVIDDPSVDLSCTDALDANALLELREALSARLFEDGRPVLKRVAAGAKLLPVGLTARVGQSVFGAMLCAQVAGLMPTDLALAVALRMPDEFLASISAALDPRRAGEVIAAIPADRVVGVAHHMIARNDYVTLARFCEFVSRETIGAVIDSIPDELQLLHIAAYVERPAKLAELVGQLAPERTRKMVAALDGAPVETWIEALSVAEQLEAAGHVFDVWPSTRGLLEAMSSEQRALVGRRVAR